MVHSASVKTNADNNSLALHVIQLEYKLRDSSSDYFKLPDSLNMDEDYVYQRYTITRAKDIKRTYFIEDYEQHSSVNFGLIFETEENKRLFK